MITVIINTRNEEGQIGDCVASARLLTDKVLVVDMHSTDKTREIAESKGAKVILFPHTQYVEPARTFAIQESQTEWLFILDADERITKELADEIGKLSATGIRDLTKNSDFPDTRYQTPVTYSYFRVPRKNIFGHKKWLRHGGWWPDYQTRFIKKSEFVEWPARIHSTPQIKGEMGFLKNPITHFFHGNIESMVEKTLNFENIESELLYNAKRPVGVLVFFRKFYGEMWRRLIKNVGFMDGSYGILESLYQAFSKTITYLLLYEKTYVKDKKQN